MTHPTAKEKAAQRWTVIPDSTHVPNRLPNDRYTTDYFPLDRRAPDAAQKARHHVLWFLVCYACLAWGLAIALWLE